MSIIDPSSFAPNAKDAIARLVTGVHRRIFTATDGRLGGRVAGMPVVKLETVGRKTGRRRETMLTSPVRKGEAVVLVASYGGDDRHPTWYLNLEANPDVTITMLGKKRHMHARVASPGESADLWPDVVDAYRGYGSYQTKTKREIPLVILEPVTR